MAKTSEQSSVFAAFRLDGSVSIITGASQGLGWDAACTLAEAGSDIVITSRDIARAKEAAGELRSGYGCDVLALSLDQRDPDQVRKMAEDARSWKGRIDILVNNAGGGSGKGTCNLFERDPGDIVNLIHINLIGALFCCREVGRIMAAQGHGKIINIASVAGLVGRDRQMYYRNNKEEQPIDYAAAKAGIMGMTRDLAGLLSPRGIHVNAISPGGFDKGELPEGFVRDYSSATMLGRMGRIGVDLKGAVLFLASSASDYVTGHNLVVDGGFSVWK